LDGLEKESTQMYVQSLNAVASGWSVRVAVEERLKAVELEIFNRFTWTSTVPGSF